MTQQPGGYAPSPPTRSGTAEPGVRAAVASGGSQVADTAAEGVKQVTAQARDQVGGMVDKGLDQVREQAKDTQRKAADGLHTIADHLDGLSEHSEQPGLVDNVVRETARRTRTAASWLSDREPGDLVEEVREFARRKPGAFLAGALAAGVLAGRLTRGLTAASRSDGDRDSAAEHRDPIRPAVADTASARHAVAETPFVPPVPVPAGAPATSVQRPGLA
ncbi:hypothetical protein [Actinokineospora globicatena]|uniref:hypothetical protein n=1 Tax=Actinokineospora globicatena TaxID=103729 RepID=UPI0020A5E2B5|nr:hypothetical protein [Actinokineospora globicatena]MCP2303715.1 hypothetical protein [Actinokineospora globicatena]GLW79141.1 hypothetical protein Aglo01_36230 [Actinokineospora globicatena]GLW86449.1 hypothetical protein Aglo02_40880 [Actinokineospora globicatena]